MRILLTLFMLTISCSASFASQEVTSQLPSECYVNAQVRSMDGKIYVQPGSVYVAPGGIYVNIQGQFISVEHLSVDDSGIYFHEHEAARSKDWNCRRCGWTNNEGRFSCVKCNYGRM